MISHDQFVSVKVGESFTVGVPVQTGTGYAWASSYTGSNISPDGTVTTPCGDEPGSTALDTFTYKGVSAGQATLILSETPPGSTTPVSTYTLAVTVKD